MWNKPGRGEEEEVVYAPFALPQFSNGQRTVRLFKTGSTFPLVSLTEDFRILFRVHLKFMELQKQMNSSTFGRKGRIGWANAGIATLVMFGNVTLCLDTELNTSNWVGQLPSAIPSVCKQGSAIRQSLRSPREVFGSSTINVLQGEKKLRSMGRITSHPERHSILQMKKKENILDEKRVYWNFDLFEKYGHSQEAVLCRRDSGQPRSYVEELPETLRGCGQNHEHLVAVECLQHCFPGSQANKFIDGRKMFGNHLDNFDGQGVNYVMGLRLAFAVSGRFGGSFE